MSEYTKDDALTCIESMRLMLGNRVGFKWLVEKLSHLAAYIESIAAKNERLNAYLDWANARDDYESYCANPDAALRDDAPEEG
ncbi:MAG: hypothetical protein Q7J82_07105 [Coriobacteriia bacterium]|nr:hypothetical protein [Coriobacteriia bacterium]